MNVASRGCYPCSGPAGTPLGHLWSHTHTHCSDTRQHSTHKGKYTEKHTHTHLTYPSPLTLSLTMVGQWDRGAIIANTTQRLGVFTVHELDVTRHAADAAVACADFLITLLFHAHSLANM